MIRIVKPSAPTVLLEDGKKATDKFCETYDSDPDYRTGKKPFRFEVKKHGKHLYAHDEVKQALRIAQHDKCAFCESKITHISFGDVEHFRPKGGTKQKHEDKLLQPGYYWLAYNWDNLLLACQLCNERFKENRFPLLNPKDRARSHRDDLSKEKPLLIDPSKEDPSNWIGFHGEEPEYPHPIKRSQKGKTTIEVFGLDREELAERRRDRLKSLKILLSVRDQLQGEDSPASAELLAEIEELIVERCSPASEYSAMCLAYLKQFAP